MDDDDERKRRRKNKKKRERGLVQWIQIAVMARQLSAVAMSSPILFDQPPDASAGEAVVTNGEQMSHARRIGGWQKF